MSLEQLFLAHGKSLFPTLQWEKLSVGEAHAIVMLNAGSFFEDEPYSYFGFWKASDQSRENEALFLKIQDWSKARSCKRILGPLDISTFFSYRLRLNPEKRPAFFGEPSNSEKEIQILQSFGFEPVQDYETLTFDEMSVLKSELAKIGSVADRTLSAAGLKIASIQPQDLKNRSEEFYQVTEGIFSENSFYLSIPKDLFLQSFLEVLVRVMDFQSSQVLLNPEGRIVGYSLLLKDPANPKHLLVKSVGVEKDYRQMGLSFLALIHKGFQHLSPDYDKVSFCLMKKNNFPSLVSKKLTGEVTNYALFGKKI